MKIFFISLASLIALFTIIYAYFGGFKKISIKIEEQGGETVVYSSILGDYKQSGEVMDKIYYSLLNDYKIITFKGFGIYYDNPQNVEKSKLRSDAGCIVEAEDIGRLKEISDFQKKELPKKEYIVCEFPYRGKISVLFSILKVYPALGKYAKENGYKEDGAVIEIYDIPSNRIMYRKEI